MTTDGGPTAGESRVLAVQVRRVVSVDTSLERTRLYLAEIGVPAMTLDVVTLKGFAPIPPGTIVRATLEYVDEEGGGDVG